MVQSGRQRPAAITCSHWCQQQGYRGSWGATSTPFHFYHPSPGDTVHGKASPATPAAMLRDSAQNYTFENIYIKNKSEHLATS